MTRDEIGVALGVILIAIAIAVRFGLKNHHLGGVILVIVGLAAIIFSRNAVAVINRDYGTKYTSRFPALWGVGIIIAGLVWFFALG